MKISIRSPGDKHEADSQHRSGQKARKREHPMRGWSCQLRLSEARRSVMQAQIEKLRIDRDGTHESEESQTEEDTVLVAESGGKFTLQGR